MTEPFLALVTPLAGGQPPGIWGGANQPFPGQLPMPGGPPPGVWPGGTPEHPIAPGSPGSPTHPIAPGGPPPQVGGGPIIPPPPAIDADMLILVWVRGHGFHWIAVDKDLVPEHPIELPPPAPTHPIAPTPPPTAAPKR